MFSWIRHRVREAFLAGVADAAHDLGLADGADSDADAATKLRDLLAGQAKTLPEPVANRVAGKLGNGKPAKAVG